MSGSQNIKTSVIPTHSWVIPLYQDENNIDVIVQRSLQALRAITPAFEIILVNDGSTDRTGERAEKLAQTHSEILLIHHPHNQGYGESLKSGFRQARASEFIGYTDGDGQYDPCELDSLVGTLAPHTALLGYKKARTDGIYRAIQSRLYNFLLRGLFTLKVKDVNCSLKWYPAGVFKSLILRSRSAFIDAEILLQLRQHGVDFLEVPVTHYERGQLAQHLSPTSPARKLSERGFGAKPRVVLDTLKELVSYRLRKSA